MGEDELYQVAETCQYPAWASREIICDRNYMEASECSMTLSGGHVLNLYEKWLFVLKSIKTGTFVDTAEGRGRYHHLWSDLISRCL